MVLAKLADSEGQHGPVKDYIGFQIIPSSLLSKKDVFKPKNETLRCASLPSLSRGLIAACIVSCGFLVGVAVP